MYHTGKTLQSHMTANGLKKVSLERRKEKSGKQCCQRGRQARTYSPYKLCSAVTPGAASQVGKQYKSPRCGQDNTPSVTLSYVMESVRSARFPTRKVAPCKSHTISDATRIRIGMYAVDSVDNL